MLNKAFGFKRLVNGGDSALHSDSVSVSVLHILPYPIMALLSFWQGVTMCMLNRVLSSAQVSIDLNEIKPENPETVT